MNLFVIILAFTLGYVSKSLYSHFKSSYLLKSKIKFLKMWKNMHTDYDKLKSYILSCDAYNQKTSCNKMCMSFRQKYWDYPRKMVDKKPIPKRLKDVFWDKNDEAWTLYEAIKRVRNDHFCEILSGNVPKNNILKELRRKNSLDKILDSDERG